MGRSYATLAELRAEGVTVTQANDARAQAALESATVRIDQLCGWWFDPQTRTLTLNGNDEYALPLPAPCVSLTSVTVDSSAYDVDDDVEIDGRAPLYPSDIFSSGPALVRGSNGDMSPVNQHRSWCGRAAVCRPRWPRGYRNVVVVGVFGRTEADGVTVNGVVPIEIKRACMMIAISQLAPLAEYDAIRDSLSAAGRIKSMKTSTQSVDFHTPNPAAGGSVLTGDPDIDAILARYRRPFAIGSV